MAIHNPLRPARTHETLKQVPGAMLSGLATKALAVARIATGFIFLWAFLDKTFGLSYATPSAKAWIHGGSPTKGFLSSVRVGPFQSAYRSMAGTWWADTLFMLGLAGIGVALIGGFALRIAATSGVLIMAMMWFAEFPPARHTSAGLSNGSSNPLVDYHFLYAVVLIALALCYAGNTWGIGRRWSTLPFVRHHAWAL